MNDHRNSSDLQYRSSTSTLKQAQSQPGKLSAAFGKEDSDPEDGYSRFDRSLQYVSKELWADWNGSALTGIYNAEVVTSRMACTGKSHASVL